MRSPPETTVYLALANLSIFVTACSQNCNTVRDSVLFENPARGNFLVDKCRADDPRRPRRECEDGGAFAEVRDNVVVSCCAFGGSEARGMKHFHGGILFTPESMVSPT
jgi:hypothetical protein